MPNVDQIAKAQARREARRAAQAEAVVKADEQDAKLSDTVKASQAAPKPAPRKTATKAEVKRAKKEAAEKQAEIDVRVVPQAPDVEAGLAAGRQGGQIPLHVMNQMAKAASRSLRDEARDIADAAGKAAFQVATGKIAMRRARGDRFSRMRDAQEAMDAHNKALAAKKE